MRLIDADKLLEQKFANPISYNAFKNLVNSQPVIEVQQWIPLAEQLPEPKTDVMVAFDDGAVEILWQAWAQGQSMDGYSDYDWKPHKPVAWKPYPESYKA